MRLKKPIPYLFASLLALGLAGLVGCKSGNSGRMGRASVDIKGRSARDIAQAATGVFKENNYRLTKSSPSELVFERPGTRQEAAKWGGWGGEGVAMQVKVTIFALAGGNTLLEAEVFAVDNTADPFFRTENKAFMLSYKTYQKLLDEVKQRLSVPTPVPTP